MKISELLPDQRNANKGTKRGAEMIEDSLRKYGAGRSILLDKYNRVIAGNKTLEQAGQIGMENVVVVESDGSKIVAVKRTDLDLEQDAKAKELAVADNRAGQVSLDWDGDVLAELAQECDLSGFFSEDELAALLPETAPGELLTDEDEVPEAPAEAETKLGDLYILGKHRLLCGDSTNIQHVERLMDGAKADMVFTDPPYGMSYEGGRSKKQFGMIKNDDAKGDNLIALVRDALGSAVIVRKEGGAAYVCFPWRTYAEFEDAVLAAGLSVDSCIVWDKKSVGLGHQDYRPQHEFIFYSKGGQFYGDRSQSDVWYMSRGNTGGYVHPTQKPVELVEKALLNSSKQGDAVLDVFGGSGSTLIACEKTGRSCYMMELDPIYCDVIVKRWENATGKKAQRITNGTATQEN